MNLVKPYCQIDFTQIFVKRILFAFKLSFKIDSSEMENYKKLII